MCRLHVVMPSGWKPRRERDDVGALALALALALVRHGRHGHGGAQDERQCDQNPCSCCRNPLRFVLSTSMNTYAPTVDAVLRSARKRLNLVPGEGPEDAEVMVVGEAPGRFEDEQGRPFVGRAGQLLDELLRGGRLRPRGGVHHQRRQGAPAGQPRSHAGRGGALDAGARAAARARRPAAGRAARPPRARALRARRQDRRGPRPRDLRARPRAVPALPPGGGAALDEAARDAVRGRPRAGRAGAFARGRRSG